MRKSEDRSTERKQSTRAGHEPAQRRSRGVGENAAERLPELSEQGGIEPIERDPSAYNDRTRDRTLNES